MTDELITSETRRLPEVGAADPEPEKKKPGKHLKTKAQTKRKHLRYKKYRELVEPAGLRAIRIYNTVLYWLLIAAVIVASFLIGRKFLAYCEDSFALYESSQLPVTYDAVLHRLNEASAEELLELLPSKEPDSGAFDSGFEKMMANYTALSGAELTAKETRSSEEGHTYNLYADGEPVGKFRIASLGQESRLGLLVMEDWEYAGGEVWFNYPVYARSYTVPEGFTVTVNGILLDESHRVGEVTEIHDLRYLAEYEPMPGMVNYHVEGLLGEPETVITDNNGNRVEFDPSAETVALPEAWNPTEPPEELAAMAVDYAKLYGEYMLHDRTLRQVQEILIPESFLWNSVKNSDGERQFVDSHRLDGYENEQVTEYIRYSDTCFSCRVTMTRDLFALRSNLAVPDVTDNYYFFVYLDISDDGTEDPGWYLCDTFGAG